MNIKKFIREFLSVYLESKSSSKKKKKKKNPLVTTSVMDTPTGSIFYMDAAVSENTSLRKSIRKNLEELFFPEDNSGILTEASAAKILPKTFNHLKWKINETQKYFLDDFINIHPDTLKESDYEYASKRTGIPVKNLKSIQNTYGEWNKKNQMVGDNPHGRYTLGSGKAITAPEYNIPQKYRNDVTNFKTVSKEEADALRYPKKTKKQKEYESNLYGMIGGMVKKSNTLNEVNFDNWAMYYIVGKLSPKDGRIDEQKRIVEIDFEPSADYYDFTKSMLNSNKKSKYWLEVEKLVNEFNDVFGTAYEIVEQYDLTNSKSKCIRIVIEELHLGDKMLWDSAEKKYVNWSQAPIDLKQQYLKNRPERMVKEIPVVDHDELMGKYLNFDKSMFKGI
jgi:hypothetical protein